MPDIQSVILQVQYAVNQGNNRVEVYHFETDSDVVILPTGDTLSKWINDITTYKKLILSGAATGEAIFNSAKPGNVEVDVEITDDGHNHTGSTVKVSSPLRVITSGKDCDLVVSDVTVDELNCLSGVTSNIQKQINELRDLIKNITGSANIPTGSTPPEDGNTGDLWMETID